MQQIFSYFFSGLDLNQWIFSKLLLAFLGGIAAYLLRNEYFTRQGESKMSVKEGLVFSLFSAIAGVALLNPSTAANSFGAGLLGVSAMTNLFKQQNVGASKKKFINKALSKKDIEKLQKEQDE